jgi:hypothetical protein
MDTLQKGIDKPEIQDFPVKIRPSKRQIEAIQDSKQITSAALQEEQFKQPLAMTTGRDQTLVDAVDSVYKKGSAVSCLSHIG